MPVQILSATYGTKTAGLDVTSACQAIVNTGNDDITFSNALAGDPDFGVVKNWGIAYITNVTTSVRCGSEGDTIDLVP